jgi:hypothetical protein
MPTNGQGVRTVPEKTAEELDERHLIDYQSYMEQLIKWLLNVGKDPERAEGYSEATIDTSAYQIDKVPPLRLGGAGGRVHAPVHDGARGPVHGAYRDAGLAPFRIA